MTLPIRPYVYIAFTASRMNIIYSNNNNMLATYWLLITNKNIRT